MSSDNLCGVADDILRGDLDFAKTAMQNARAAVRDGRPREALELLRIRDRALGRADALAQICNRSRTRASMDTRESDALIRQIAAHFR